MSVSFTPQAREDLDGIRSWIAVDDARAADRVVNRIVQTASLIGQVPRMGRRGKVTGTREFSVVGLPYLVVYRLGADDEVDIVTVIHTSRKYPPDVGA